MRATKCFRRCISILVPEPRIETLLAWRAATRKGTSDECGMPISLLTDFISYLLGCARRPLENDTCVLVLQVLTQQTV